MTKDVVTVDSDKIVFDATILMSEKEIACLVVIDDKTTIGIFTERGFVRIDKEFTWLKG
ncbi:CBS domain-containing protein [Candidatus Bathyarchaeota archaeon]|nr:CBS domain-containing protein [Candidatus Bathyarchaeota archaeon]